MQHLLGRGRWGGVRNRYLLVQNAKRLFLNINIKIYFSIYLTHYAEAHQLMTHLTLTNDFPAGH